MRIHKKKVEVIDQYDYIRINSLLIDFLVFLISRPFWVLNIALVLVDIPPQWMQCLNKFFNGWSWAHTHPLHSSLDQYEVLPQYQKATWLLQIYGIAVLSPFFQEILGPYCPCTIFILSELNFSILVSPSSSFTNFGVSFHSSELQFSRKIFGYDESIASFYG